VFNKHWGRGRHPWKYPEGAAPETLPVSNGPFKPEPVYGIPEPERK
jgi:hypothetical protein